MSRDAVKTKGELAPDPRFERWGASLRDDLKAWDEARPRTKDETAFLAIESSRARGRRWLPLLVPTFAVLALALAFLVLELRRERPLSAEFGGRALPVGEALEVVSAGTLSFEDGTELAFEASSKGVLVESNPHGATVRLEKGALTASVVPRPQAHWSILAGPYEVHVHGTRFRVTWDERSREFTLALFEGIVGVRGPGFEKEKRLAPGDRLTLQAEKSTLAELDGDGAPTRGEVASPTQAPSKPEATSESAAETNTHPGNEKTQGEASNTKPDAPEDSASTLFARADRLRLLGRSSEASSTLREVRRRFPRSPEAALASYSLGVLAFSSSPSESAGWFETYLREAPRGPLVREALGRAMEAQSRNGQTEKAREAARRYLKAYPNGPHRDIALRLVEPHAK